MLAVPHHLFVQRSESRMVLGVLLGVLLLHASLYLLWPQLKAMHKDELSQAASLIFLKRPEPTKSPSLPPFSRLPGDITAPSPQIRVPLVSRQSSAISEPDKAIVSGKPQTVSAVEKTDADSGTDAPVNRDTRGIFNGLKKDFQYRDQVSAKVAPAAMEKFAAAVQASSTVMRESYKHEVHILGDGRPVSKVITPFGTYCILHRKPGEIIGNELPTTPVTCGNL
ncbi:MAG: hypothetical protein V4495_15495 [Pseudomonadota bacterium]